MSVNSQDVAANRSALDNKFTWNSHTAEKDIVYQELEVNELQWEDQEDDDTPPFRVSLADQDHTKSNGINTAQKYATLSKSQPVNEVHLNVMKQRKPDGNQRKYFSLLSDETVLHIFSFLTKASLCKCARVSKEWKRLSYDEALWTSVSMSDLQLKSDGAVGNILLRGVKVLRIAKSQIYGSIFVDNMKIRPLPRQKRGSNGSLPLEYLDASLCKFNNGTLTQLLQRCQRLKRLSLEGIMITEPAIRAVGNNRHLETLNLCMCSGLTPTGIEYIAQNCQRLKFLNVAWTDMEAESLQIVCSKISTLEALNISGHRMDMTDSTLKLLLDSCPNLINLDISDSPMLGPESLDLLMNHGKIKILAISRCFNIPARQMSSLTQMKTLKELEIYGFLNEESLHQIARLAPNLQLNNRKFSTIARPCVGVFNGKIWDADCCIR